jgi:cytochrome c oxidase subunit II
MTASRRTKCAFAVFIVGAIACTPDPGDAQGRGISDLYGFFTVLAAVIFVITAGLIAWSIMRYRARPNDDELPRQFHSNVPLELVWFAIPQIIVIVLFVVSVNTLNDVEHQEESPAVTVEVEGFQWGWRFTYADADVVIEGTASDQPEIQLPVGQTVAFMLSSDDVVHSFYVPRFLMKRDVIPGRTNRFDVVIEDEGTYDGKCAEFCGLLHGEMNFSIRAVSPEEFERWLTSQGG